SRNRPCVCTIAGGIDRDAWGASARSIRRIAFRLGASLAGNGRRWSAKVVALRHGSHGVPIRTSEAWRSASHAPASFTAAGAPSALESISVLSGAPEGSAVTTTHQSLMYARGWGTRLRLPHPSPVVQSASR